MECMGIAYPVQCASVESLHAVAVSQASFCHIRGVSVASHSVLSQPSHCYKLNIDASVPSQMDKHYLLYLRSFLTFGACYSSISVEFKKLAFSILHYFVIAAKVFIISHLIYYFGINVSCCNLV